MIMIIVLEFVFYFVLIGLLLSWRTLTLALHLCFITSALHQCFITLRTCMHACMHTYTHTYTQTLALHQCFITLRFALPHSYACSDIATRRTKTCCPRLYYRLLTLCTMPSDSWPPLHPPPSQKACRCAPSHHAPTHTQNEQDGIGSMHPQRLSPAKTSCSSLTCCEESHGVHTVLLSSRLTKKSFDSCPGVFVSTPSMESPALAPSTRIPLRRVCS